VRLLLDTHILLWWLADDAHLPAKARKWIAREAESVFVSTASQWEISLKAATGKLRADVREIHRQIEHGDYIYLPVEPDHRLELCALSAHHSDPFDRMLIAQAVSEKLKLLTSDALLENYGEVVLLA
jgi:PIN domain nuclease of toxin-antitoxin system